MGGVALVLSACSLVSGSREPRRIWDAFRPGLGIADAFPAGAVGFLRREGRRGTLWNEYVWGGYLIWALPTHPVSIDGRTNLYGSDGVTRAMSTWAGGPGWDADPELTSAKLVIAPVELPLTKLLRERPTEWRVVFEDETAAVFVAAGR